MRPENKSIWSLVPPKPWEESESGLVMANKDDIKSGKIPLLKGVWHSACENYPPNKWIPYSDVVDGKVTCLSDDEELFVDEVCIEDQTGNRKRISVPNGVSTYFYACGHGIYRHVDKLIFNNTSPHTWCGVENTSLVTIDLMSFSVTVQNLGEPGFICSYLEALTGQSASLYSDEIYSWSNSYVDFHLSHHGNKLFMAAELPKLTLEMDWAAGRWQLVSHKQGRCVIQNESISLWDMEGRSNY